MYMAVWGVLPHSDSIFYRIFVNYTSDFRHFPKNRRFASGGGWQNGAFVHFAVEVCRFGRRLDLPSLYPAGGVPALPPPYPAISFAFLPPIPPARARRALFPAALAILAPGERTISNAEVPLPRSPLSLAAGTANRKAVLSLLRRVGDSEGTPAGCRIGRANQCRAGSVAGMQGAKPLA